MKYAPFGRVCAALFVSCTMILSAAGCAGAVDDEPAVIVEEAAGLADGTYPIEVETDSSMFRADSCTLTVADGSYTAELVLPGEGFSRLYFGSAEEAATADDADIYDFYLNDEGKYTFKLPVTALDEDLQIAAFGHRRDTWYDHTITFHVPTEGAVEGAE